MRTAFPLALVALLVFGVARLARGEDGDLPTATEALAQRVQQLELQTQYLLAREQRTTAYLSAYQRLADDLKRATGELRAGGFAAAANPSPTRERLLQALEQLAQGLSKDLPALTQDEIRQREAATAKK